MDPAIIYHTDVDKKTATPDDLDVFDEVDFVSSVLSRLGYDPIPRPFTLDFTNSHYNPKRVLDEIANIAPKFVFNLVEVVDGKENLTHLAPEVFETAGVPYTGCTRSAFVKSASKVSSKNILRKNNLPTPYYLTQENLHINGFDGKKFLIKSSVDHASKGLEERLYSGKDEIKAAFEKKGQNFFAEEYIEGREFNISMIGNKNKSTVLPLAEILFEDWNKDKLKIVGYSAKWDENAPEYSSTVRSFDFPESDNSLISHLRSVCKSCWKLFDLRGYARIDFRVSEENKPYILEINTNPCISPDAGFIAAAEKAGMTHEQIIGKIVDYSFN